MKKTRLIALLLVLTLAFGFASCARAAETEKTEFVLVEKMAELEGKELYMLIGFAVITIVLAVAVFAFRKQKKTEHLEVKKSRAIVLGALCMSLAFVLSYVKLFSLPYGGSITFCSMLPIVLYASWMGPSYGFLVAFAYGILQVIQGADVVHYMQFILDYIFAFTVLGLASLFRSDKTRPIGIVVAGFARMMCSVVSGVVFFSEAINIDSVGYSFLYNMTTIGVDTLICLVVYIIPPVRKTLDRLKDIAVKA